MMLLSLEQDLVVFLQACIHGRANLKTLVIYYDESSLEKAKKIENYYGIENGITGKDLYEIGIRQAKSIGSAVKKEEVIKIEIIENGFKVVTVNGEYKSISVILATGNKKNKPKIKGIDKFEGKGVSYCAICDGFFYKNKSVAVVGSGNYAISETNELIPIVEELKILTNGEDTPEFRADNVEVNTKPIKEILGENKVEEITFEDETKIKVDGIFIAEGSASSLDFAKKLGIITKQDKIIVNENMETNIKGLYACGDCIGGLLQISKAVSDGSKAGMQAIKFIREKKANINN
jgi:thioredoxin reductase (NADPH)